MLKASLYLAPTARAGKGDLYGLVPKQHAVLPLLQFLFESLYHQRAKPSVLLPQTGQNGGKIRWHETGKPDVFSPLCYWKLSVCPSCTALNYAAANGCEYLLCAEH